MKKFAPYLLVILLFAFGGWYFFTKEPDPVHELPPPALSLPVAPVTVDEGQVAEPGTSEPQPMVETPSEPEPDPLPSLYESDPAIRQSLAEVMGMEAVQQYLVKDQAITRMVAAIDSLTSRQVPPPTNPVKSAEGAFLVETEGDRTIMSAANFARYGNYVELLYRMDAGTLLAVYREFYPLFQQAWEENDNQGSFNDRLVEVIDNLLATPDVPGPVYLVKPEAVYLFEDPALEGMTAGQKILVRMGSANAALVKEKLLELRSALITSS
jgi:hypothetical protein